jgi:hypothetical protein
MKLAAYFWEIRFHLSVGFYIPLEIGARKKGSHFHALQIRYFSSGGAQGVQNTCNISYFEYPSFCCDYMTLKIGRLYTTQIIQKCLG